MSSPSFIEFGQPPFPRSDTLSQSGPLKMSQFIVQIYILLHPALGTKVRVSKVKHDFHRIAEEVN